MKLTRIRFPNDSLGEASFSMECGTRSWHECILNFSRLLARTSEGKRRFAGKKLIEILLLAVLQRSAHSKKETSLPRFLLFDLLRE